MYGSPKTKFNQSKNVRYGLIYVWGAQGVISATTNLLMMRNTRIHDRYESKKLTMMSMVSEDVCGWFGGGGGGDGAMTEVQYA